MLICYNYLGQVKAEIPENLPPFVAAELLMRLKGRQDFDAVEAEAEEEEAYKSETNQKEEGE